MFLHTVVVVILRERETDRERERVRERHNVPLVHVDLDVIDDDANHDNFIPFDHPTIPSLPKPLLSHLI